MELKFILYKNDEINYYEMRYFSSRRVEGARRMVFVTMTKFVSARRGRKRKFSYNAPKINCIEYGSKERAVLPCFELDVVDDDDFV